MPNQSLPDLPLPSGWGKNVKCAVLHVVSLARYAIISARGWAAINHAGNKKWPTVELKQVA